MHADPTSDPTSTPDAEAVERHVESRAELLPEEQAAGSEDPRHQAEEILHDSDERTAHPEETGEASTQTSTPRERPDVRTSEEELHDG